MQKRKQLLIFVLLAIIPILTIWNPSTKVRAEDTAIEDESGNITITVYTNKDVDMMLMDTGHDTIEITPQTEYRDEQLKGNNQVMDINGDMDVDQTDYDILKAHIEGSCKTFTSKIRCTHCGATDINGDKKIDNEDLKILKSHINNKCELNDCYFHGTRVYREDNPDDRHGYIWKIHYTPTIAGIRTFTFTPQSYTSTGVRNGEIKTISIHAEEHKNPELIKAYVGDSYVDKYLIYSKAYDTPIFVYAVTPLETDKVKITIKNELYQGDITEVELTEWTDIDYNKNEKIWRYDYVTEIRGIRNITIVGYGEQSEDVGGWLEGDPVSLRQKVVNPLLVSPLQIVTKKDYLEVWYTYTSHIDEEGNQTFTEHRHEKQWYKHTLIAKCNEDTDFVEFETPQGVDLYYEYSQPANSDIRTFKTSWIDDKSSGSGKVIPHSHITIFNEDDRIFTCGVHFFPQNGESINPITVKYDTLISEPKTPEKEGYFFKGWFKDERGFNQWNFSTDKVLLTTRLYAQWEKRNYKITFNTQGGTEIAPKIIPYQTLFNPPGEPEKEGYVFKGWFKESDCKNAWDFSSERLYSDLTLYAKWVPFTYKVSFDTKGGNPVSPIGVLKGDKLPDSLDTPYLMGFLFDGWFKNTETTIPWQLGIDVVTEDTKLYAKWRIAEYQINFDTQGGSIVNPVSGVYNSLITKPEDPVLKGYTFKGWFREKEGTNQWQFNIHPIVEPTTLYAKWEANQAIINFETNGGTKIPRKIGRTGDQITDRLIPASNQAGYVINGWYENEDFSGELITLLPETFKAGTVTYYAKWDPNETQIIFNTNEGSIIEPIAGKYGEIIDNRNPPEPTREGYTFVGFYRNNEFTGGIITQLPEKYPAENIIYYAKWEANRSEIKFNTNLGLYIKSYVGTTDQLLTTTSMPETQREGYVFNGWFDNTECNGDAITTLPLRYPVGIKTYHAKWTADHSVIRFDVDGGDLIADIVGETDEVVPGELENANRTGYLFAGWHTKPNGVGTRVKKLPSVFPAGITTYYAKWVINEYNVNFDVDGDNNIASQTIDYNNRITKPKNPVKEGYQFLGWFLDPEKTTMWNFDTDVVTDNMTLYAKWTASEASIIFELDGGTGVSNMIGVTDQLIEPLTMPIPVKIGYVFSGWYKNNEHSGETVGELPLKYPAGITTYYAKWVINTYNLTFVSDGGNIIEPQIINYNEIAVRPENPLKKGYAFDNWYTDPEKTTIWNFDTDKITTNTVLYAKWIINTYDVNFDNDGIITTQTIDYNQKVSEPTDPTKSGYTFAGWFFDPEKTIEWDFDTDVVTSTMTLYAKWTADASTIEFDVAGGEAIADIVGVTDEVVPGTLADAVKTGYTFAGWFTEVNGAGVKITALPATFPVGGVTYYANWTADASAISFVTNGGTVISSRSGVTDALITPTIVGETTSKQGFTFEGWFTDAGFTSEEVVAFPTTYPAGGVTYYAKWSANDITINFVSGDSAQTFADIVKKADSTGHSTAMPVPEERAGYTFNGWYTTAE